MEETIGYMSHEGIRIITIIKTPFYGIIMPMYKSSGQNSGFGGTWFPFKGIGYNKFTKPMYNDEATINEGWLSDHDSKDWQKCLKQWKDLFARLGNLDGLACSYIMGEGELWTKELWDGSYFFDKLVAYLPDVFIKALCNRIIEPIDIPRASAIYTNINDVNDWFCRRIKILVPNYKDYSRAPNLYDSEIKEPNKLILTKEMSYLNMDTANEKRGKYEIEKQRYTYGNQRNIFKQKNYLRIQSYSKYYSKSYMDNMYTLVKDVEVRESLQNKLKWDSKIYNSIGKDVENKQMIINALEASFQSAIRSAELRNYITDVQYSAAKARLNLPVPSYIDKNTGILHKR
jgi:hypothetical protein